MPRRLNLRRLERELHRQQRERQEQVRAVIRKHARLSRRGNPSHCQPTFAERAGLVPRRVPPHADGKVIYDSRAAAEACADELDKTLNAGRQYAYLCRRRLDHFHLSRRSDR